MALHIGIVDIRHSPVILVHFERFNATYDQWVKLLIQDLKDEGMYGGSGRKVAKILIETLQSVSSSFLSDDRQQGANESFAVL